MIEIMTSTPLRDAMYAMSLAKPIPDAELLDEFVRRYPQHGEALTEFAIELAIDALMHHEDEQLDIPVDPEAVSPVVSRVMSRFQNRLYEVRQGRATESPARVATASVENPFAALDREEFRVLARRINVNTVLLSKLRDRHIDPMTIPIGFCRLVADEMDESLEALTSHLYALPQVSQARQFYKAEGKPAATARQTFKQAVRGSGLNDDQQQRLMSIQD